MQQRGLIVVYHRIAEPTLDPQLLCVSPQHFAEHLEIMTRSYAPLSLRALGQRVEEGRVPSRALVVTFDDGYADNLSHATPLLERYASRPLSLSCLVRWVRRANSGGTP
jgi:peptidoglycan/xylan/chitin deacetylase (PgdA/CDA1 family)